MESKLLTQLAGLLHIFVSHSYSMHQPEGWRLVSHDTIHEIGDSPLLIPSAPMNFEEAFQAFQGIRVVLLQQLQPFIEEARYNEQRNQPLTVTRESNLRIRPTDTLPQTTTNKPHQTNQNNHTEFSSLFVLQKFGIIPIQKRRRLQCHNEGLQGESHAVLYGRITSVRELPDMIDLFHII